MSNSRIKNKIKELEEVVEEEIGEKPDISVQFFNSGNFSDVVKKSNHTVSELDVRHKKLWSNNGSGGAIVKKDNTEFSFYFTEPVNLLISDYL